MCGCVDAWMRNNVNMVVAGFSLRKLNSRNLKVAATNVGWMCGC